MLTLPPAVRVYVSTGPTNMHKSYDGLSSLVAGVIGQDPTSGHLFVFFGRRAARRVQVSNIIDISHTIGHLRLTPCG